MTKFFIGLGIGFISGAAVGAFSLWFYLAKKGVLG